MAVKTYFKIWLLQVKNSLMQRMSYRFNFVVLCFSVLVQTSLILIFVKAIFSFIDNISGWSYEHALLIAASFMIIEGLIWATSAYLSGVGDSIRRGALDQLITKPVDTQFLVSIWRADPEDWIRVVTGIIIISTVFDKINFSILNLLFYVLLLFNSYIIVYSFILFLKTFSFWIINNYSLNMLADHILRLSQYPTDIFFHKIIRIFFSTVIPLAFIATMPAKILIHGPKLDLIFYSCLLAFVFFVGSRKFFLYGLKHYSSASS